MRPSSKTFDAGFNVLLAPEKPVEPFFKEFWMKRLLMSSVGLLALGLVALTPTDGFGFGCRRACGGCSTPCAVSVECAPIAPAPVQFVERKVITYKDNWVERDIVEQVSRMVPKTEKYNYVTLEQKVTPTKRKFVVNRQVMSEEKFNYTVSVPVTTVEKRKEVFYTSVSKVVPYEYTVMVPRVVSEKRKVMTYEIQTSVVKEMVPVCRTIRVACCDPCDPCGRVRYTCQRVTEMQEVCRTVCNRIPVEREVVVNRTICEAQQRKGERTVCELVRGERDVNVNVCSFRQEQRQGVRQVCNFVPEEREEVVNVVTCERVERVGERQVYTCVVEDVKRKVKVNQPIAVETVERVPVCVYTSYCDTGHSRGCCLFGGLRRGCGGCR
jgi:hypothetical protein